MFGEARCETRAPPEKFSSSAEVLESVDRASIVPCSYLGLDSFMVVLYLAAVRLESGVEGTGTDVPNSQHEGENAPSICHINRMKSGNLTKFSRC
jgi:hypothetical protein